MPDACVDCRTPKFTSGFTETFQSRTYDGSSVLVTVRLCLECGARFAGRDEMRDYLARRLPAHAVSASVAAAR